MHYKDLLSIGSYRKLNPSYFRHWRLSGFRGANLKWKVDSRQHCRLRPQRHLQCRLLHRLQLLHQSRLIQSRLIQLQRRLLHPAWKQFSHNPHRLQLLQSRLIQLQLLRGLRLLHFACKQPSHHPHRLQLLQSRLIQRCLLRRCQVQLQNPAPREGCHRLLQVSPPAAFMSTPRGAFHNIVFSFQPSIPTALSREAQLLSYTTASSTTA